MSFHPSQSICLMGQPSVTWEAWLTGRRWLEEVMMAWAGLCFPTPGAGSWCPASMRGTHPLCPRVGPAAPGSPAAVAISWPVGSGGGGCEACASLPSAMAWGQGLDWIGWVLPRALLCRPLTSCCCCERTHCTALACPTRMAS